jgi:hypothetical protein
MLKKKLAFFIPNSENGQELPFVGGIKAGFPSPAADFEDDKISLDKVWDFLFEFIDIVLEIIHILKLMIKSV